MLQGTRTAAVQIFFRSGFRIAAVCTLSQSFVPSALRRARWASRSLFAALGVFVGVWGAHIPSVKSHYGLDEATLAGVLLSGALGALGMLLLAGRVVARLGSRHAALFAGLLLSLAFSLMLKMPGQAGLVLLVFSLGAGTSLLDVALNSEAVELELLGGRAIMSNLHAMYSLGGMFGAGLAAALLRAGLVPARQLAGVAAALAAVLALGTRGMLGRGSADAEAAHFAWPRGRLLLIGLLVLAGLTIEGAVSDWGVLYIKQELGLPQAHAALGYAAFAGAMAASRLAGDALRERFAEPVLLAAGACVVAVAMAAVLLIGKPGVALVGFALVGAGLAPVVPILYNAATRVPGLSRAAAIASISSIGYCGFLISPPLIGSLAHVRSLTAALSVVVVMAALLAVGARYVPAKA